ncbi:MAG: prolipoprotein diacylglyceryl transferase [Lachnospiraceae bacterium]
MYKDNLKEIFNIRNGGLAIYGGIIFGLITVLLYCHVKKKKFLHMADFLILGVVFGQIMGRWGNFFNREAFGEYTDGLFAMQLPVSAVRSNEITQTMWDHVQTIGGVQFIQVFPTFLYESLWNLALLMLLLYITYHKKFDGQVFCTYLMGYGLGRVWIEALRTDQLLLPGTTIAVSQLLSAVVAVGSFVWLARQHFKHRSEGCMVEEKPATPEENNKNVG